MCALTLVVVGIWAYASHWKHVAQAQKAQAAQAVRQAKIATVTTQALDQAATKTQQINTHTTETIRVIQKAEGADSPVPVAVRDAWLTGLPDDPEKPAG